MAYQRRNDSDPENTQYQQGFQSFQPPPQQPPQPPYQPQYQSYQQPMSFDQPPPPPPPTKPPTVGPLESDHEKKQNMIVRILRVLFIAFQSVALLAGIALVIAGSLWYRQVRKQALHMTLFGIIPMYAIGAGVSLTLLSCIGLVSAITRGRSGAVVYSLLMLCLIGCQGYMLFRTTRLDRQVMHYLSRHWDELSDKQRVRMQQWRKCCGFAGVDDRAVQPCPEQAEQGCAVPVMAVARRWAGGVVKGLAVSMTVEVVLITLALVISFSTFK